MRKEGGIRDKSCLYQVRWQLKKPLNFVMLAFYQWRLPMSMVFHINMSTPTPTLLKLR